MEWVVILVLAFLLFKSGALANLGLGSPSGYVAPPQAVAPQTAAQISAAISSQTSQEAQIATGTLQGGTVVATSILKSVGASTSAISVIPVVGAAFALIASTLIAASQKRAKEAETENQAVAQGIPGFDQAVAQIVAGYNSKSLTVMQVQSLLKTVMANYWNEVTPQIQPGRNGCQSGANCPSSSAPNSGSATNAGGNNYCSGNIGAACCVGCADLQLSVDNMEWAVAYADTTGKPATAFVQIVFASKYGGVNRPAYTVIFTP